MCVCACVHTCACGLPAFSHTQQPRQDSLRRLMKRLSAERRDAPRNLSGLRGVKQSILGRWGFTSHTEIENAAQASAHPHGPPLWSLLLSLLFSHTCKHCAASVCCAFHLVSPLQEQRHCLCFRHMKVESNKIMLRYNFTSTCCCCCCLKN